MAARSSTAAAKTGRDLTAEIAYLTRALKAPTVRDSVDRLAERAVAESWSHLEFLVACLHARFRPARLMAVRAASVRPGSRPASRWRSLTSITPAA